MPNNTFWGHLMITGALWRVSVDNGYRYSILWAYPLITEIYLERNTVTSILAILVSSAMPTAI